MNGTMHWVRGQGKRLSLLALFALAVQLGLSFGHIHADPAWSTMRGQTIASLPSSSADPAGHVDADDLCPICVAAAMVANAVDAVPPVLPVPASFSIVAFEASGEPLFAARRFESFRSRAPPAFLT